LYVIASLVFLFVSTKLQGFAYQERTILFLNKYYCVIFKNILIEI